MKKILFVINNFSLGGAERLVADQINNLDRTRFQPFILTLLAEPEKSLLPEVKAASEKKWQVRVRGLWDLSAVLKIKRLIQENKIDIVITNLFLANTFGRAGARLAGVKNIFSYEHSVYKDKRAWQIIVDKILARFTKKIFVGAKDVLDFTARQEKIPAEKFALNYNAADFKRLRLNPEKRGELRQKFGVTENALVIAAAGRLIEQKGHKYLIEAMAELGSDVFCLIFGQGVLEKTLREQIQSLGLSRQVKLAGLAPMEEILSVADIFVLPSLWEGLSIALVQALSVGLPIVATNVSGSNEAVRDNENGLLVSPKDRGALAAALQKLISDASLRERLGLAAKASADKFSIEENLKRLEHEFGTIQ